MKMRVTDYIANYIYDVLQVPEVFMLTGGGAMFLNDGVAKHDKLKVICNHHEQACAMGAVAYSKYTNKIGVAYVTTGCGGTNAITGVLDAWQDSTQALFISGQVKKKETCYNTDLPLRQFGVQEADIVSVVKSITKYAIMVNEPNDIAYHIEKACYLAKSGRPGPVWIDIPLDVQGATIDTDNLKHFDENDYLMNFDANILESIIKPKDAITSSAVTEIKKYLKMIAVEKVDKAPVDERSNFSIVEEKSDANEQVCEKIDVEITEEAQNKLSKMESLAQDLKITGTPKIFVIDNDKKKIIDVINGANIPQIEKYFN